MKSIQEWRAFNEINEGLLANIVVTAGHLNILLKQLENDESIPEEVKEMVKRVGEQASAMVENLEALKHRNSEVPNYTQ